jgi:hypothetical protein
VHAIADLQKSAKNSSPGEKRDKPKRGVVKKGEQVVGFYRK